MENDKKEYSICAISDMHGFLPKLEYFQEPCDILVIAGDICPVRLTQIPHIFLLKDITKMSQHDLIHDIDIQRQWIKDTFIPWCELLYKNQLFKHIVFIAGNHDFVFAKYNIADIKCKKHIKFPEYVHYLNNSFCMIDDKIKIYGCPYCLKFGNYAFMVDEDELFKIYANVPKDIDIFISHGPAWGMNDENIDGIHCGSKSLSMSIGGLFQPQYMFYGHIHEACKDVYKIDYEGSDKGVTLSTKIVNCSILNMKYEAYNTPPFIGKLYV